MLENGTFLRFVYSFLNSGGIIMKSILLATLTIGILSVIGCGGANNHSQLKSSEQLTLYRNTTWQLTRGAESFTVKFDAVGADVDAKVSGTPFVVRANYLQWLPRNAEGGVNADQDAIIGYINPKTIAFGLYVKDATCLLLPDTETPADCLRKVK